MNLHARSCVCIARAGQTADTTAPPVTKTPTTMMPLTPVTTTTPTPVTTTTPLTPVANTEPATITTIPTSVAVTAVCKKWCESSQESWPRKCRWTLVCGGCAQCSGMYLCFPTTVNVRVSFQVFVQLNVDRYCFSIASSPPYSRLYSPAPVVPCNSQQH